MRARAKAVQNPHDRIMEIVGILLKRIVATPGEQDSEGELLKGLEEQGYRRAEIDAAIELVFAVPVIITAAYPRLPEVPPAQNSKVRVFAPDEERKLSTAVRGRMLQYRALGLINESEWEEILIQLLFTESREVGLTDMHEAINRVINDKERIMLLMPGPIRSIYSIMN